MHPISAWYSRRYYPLPLSINFSVSLPSPSSHTSLLKQTTHNRYFSEFRSNWICCAFDRSSFKSLTSLRDGSTRSWTGPRYGGCW
ncbi:hypothetical protein L1987_70438 [Smallanthus sonchifolius]|uniref:Uncharacterized protein n=1 Tax=Smallanthus sonchifolius TaxID=185202 RepID=A0ACB9APA6_9ASTR|nr:hypothetical protein L1987_70438 [Smallanthus sonchifolius]